MGTQKRFILLSPDGRATARGAPMVLQGEYWNIIGWDDRRCFLMIERQGAVCQLPRQACFDLGYRWRPLAPVDKPAKKPRVKQIKKWRGKKRILKPRVTIS
jgi:hypothetical protein